MDNYAIIDHAGSVGACKELYRKAFATAKGFEKVFTLKNVCIQYSPYAREITDKMKYFHRYNRTPKMVYIVCASQFEPKAQFIANIWESRNIPVAFIEENPAPKALSAVITKARRCAHIWSNALGWEFSAPLFRDLGINQIDMFTKRPNMERENGSFAAKRTTNPQTYFESFRAVASEEECQQFFQHYAYLQKNNLLQDFLEPGYSLCPTCGRPVRETATECTWCDHEFEAFEFETFYEDSYNDDPDINYESTSSSASLPKFAEVEWTHADAATAKYEKELPWLTMLNTIRFDFS